jgi:hypothetical protein
MKLHAWLALLAALATQVMPARAQTAPAERHTRHALVIGIGDYADPDVPALKGVVHDMDSARLMAHAMAVPEGNITVLRDRDATAARIRAEITALHARMGDGDRVFIYYSGHGTRWLDPRLKGEKGDGCTEGLLASDGEVLSNTELGARLAPVAQRADKMLVFYDACFSGGVAGAPFRTRSLALGGAAITPKFTAVGAPAQCSQPSNFRSRGLAPALQQARALPQNVVHIAASRPDEVSFDSSTQGGFATAAWRDCLLGEARDLDGSGAVTVDEVTACAQAKVSAALAGQPGILGQQMTVAGNGGFVPAWMGAAFESASSASSASPALAASAAAPVRSATPAALLTEVYAQRDGNRPLAASLRRPRLRIGSDALELDVTPSRDGWLYLALAGSDGQSLYLLYPNDLAGDNQVRAGRRVSLPDPRWEIVPGGPAGTETLLVMVSDAPRDLGALAREKFGPFMRSLLDRQGRARLQWVLGNGTPGAGCGKPGSAPCSDAFGAALLQVETVP